MKVIAGTGSNSTEEAIDLTRFAKKVGADAALHVVPYYNKPTQEGMFRHFKAIARAVDIPIILYNIPGRTGVTTVANATVARPCQRVGKIIVGMKEATPAASIPAASWPVSWAKNSPSSRAMIPSPWP